MTGQVQLTDIAFAVPAGLIGLESLARYPTLIQSVDVTGGTVDAILLNITGASLLLLTRELKRLTDRFQFDRAVGLTNPSNLDLEVGDVTFQLFQEKNFLGTTVLPVRRLSLCWI